MKFEEALALLWLGKTVHTPGEVYYYRLSGNRLEYYGKVTFAGDVWSPTAYDIMTREYELYEPPWDGVVPEEPGPVYQEGEDTNAIRQWGRLGWETAKREREPRLNASSSNEA